jgi:hypothetical protein
VRAVVAQSIAREIVVYGLWEGCGRPGEGRSRRWDGDAVGSRGW